MVAFRHREVWREFNKKQKAIAEAEGHGGLVSYSLGDMPDVPLGRWQAWHRQCDPHPDSNSYWIAVERCKTLGELVHWAGHLMQKNWMQDTDLSRLLLELGTWS